MTMSLAESSRELEPLRSLIAREIAERGPIPFSRYMELCLYHPQLGYYSRPQEKFGKAGDFYTASDVHAVFGRLLARQFDEMWRRMGSPVPLELVELGPGRGLFMADAIAWAKRKFPDFHAAAQYVLAEQSPALQRVLRERFAELISRGKLQVGALDDLYRSTCFTDAILFANEFFDALPVEVLAAEGQVYVDIRAGRFVETLRSPSPELHSYVDRYSVRPEPGERIEAPLVAIATMRDLARQMQRGILLIVDYGYTRQEQLAGRHRDTLMTFRRHTASADPYQAPGEQDITAHVNFTALRAAGEAAGMDFLALVTQSQFLLGIGEANQFADAFEDCRQPQESAKVALQLKHLVAPAGMGESFHALVMSKGLQKETAARLSGLSFSLSAGR